MVDTMRRWYLPFLGTLVLFLAFHQLFSRRHLAVNQGLVALDAEPTEEIYDVRNGVPLVESEQQVDPQDDPKNMIVLKETTGEEFDDEAEIEDIIEREKQHEDVVETENEMQETEEIEEMEGEEEEEEEEEGTEEILEEPSEEVDDKDYDETEEDGDYVEEGEFAEESNIEEDSQILKIHVNSYQRSGSSFVAKLFDVYQPAFFVYEPLEMLYTALYGVEEDNVIPHNIFFTHDQKYRTPDKDELEMTRWAMDQVYKCDMQSYPTAMLINVFWSKFTKFMTIGTPYVECLEKSGINMTLSSSSLSQCQQHIREPCADTFSTRWQDDLDKCRKVLYANGEWQSSVDSEVWKQFEGTKFGEHRENFEKYFTCLSPYELTAHQCAALHLDEECKKKVVRVVKTVRALMDLSAVFLKDYVNFKVVHLFRDPRGVTLSRMKADWSYAVFESSDPSILARTYCRVIMNEISKREKLEAEYEGRIVSLVHDELLTDIVNGAKDIFTSLGLNYTKEVSHYVEVYTNMSKRDRWKTTLTVKNIRSIEKECQELMNTAAFEIYEQNAADDKARSKQIKEFNLRKQLNKVK